MNQRVRQCDLSNVVQRYAALKVFDERVVHDAVPTRFGPKPFGNADREPLQAAQMTRGSAFAHLRHFGHPEQQSVFSLPDIAIASRQTLFELRIDGHQMECQLIDPFLSGF